MFARPEIMRLAQDLAGHSTARQEQIAQNVANADTPGYRARDLVDFADFYSSTPPAQMRATRAAHTVEAIFGDRAATVIDMKIEPAPNGNSVSLENEMIKQAETRHHHDMALAVYKSSLDLMRAVVGRGR